jgi:DNA-binding response OmpR family regulator
MNTKKVLLLSDDADISGIVRISALTLTKLNCQIALEELREHEAVLAGSESPNLNLIIIDNDQKAGDTISLISSIRKKEGSATKKILLIHSGEIDKSPFFKAGCDSIMRKDEFKRVVNNILAM